MNCRTFVAEHSSLIFRTALAGFLVLTLVEMTCGQEQPDGEQRPELKPQAMVAPMRILNEGGEKALPSRDGGVAPGAGVSVPTRLKSEGVTVRGRVRTTLLSDRNHDVKIVEDPARGILIDVVRHYSSKQLGMLKGKYPELSDYVDLFPTAIGDEEIELTLSFKKRYQAKSVAELKEQSLDAFQIFRKHLRTHGDHLSKF